MNTMRTTTVAEELALHDADEGQHIQLALWLLEDALCDWFYDHGEGERQWHAEREAEATIRRTRWAAMFCPTIQKRLDHFDHAFGEKVEMAEAYAAMKRAEKYGW